jgi:hypothetical protein
MLVPELDFGPGQVRDETVSELEYISSRSETTERGQLPLPEGLAD